MSRAAPVLFTAFFLLALACARDEPDPASPADAAPAPAPGPDETGLRPIPEPDLTAADPQVRAQIEGKRTALAELEADPAAEAGALAQASGELGLVYLIYDFVDAADAAIANAHALAPDEFRWIYFRGYLHKMQGRLAGAAASLELALEREPEFLPAAVRLGQVRLEMGQPEAARQLFERALEIDPSCAAAFEGLGRVATTAGDARAAVDYLEKALAAEPGANSLHYALGQAYRNLGDLDRARFHLARRGDVPVRIPDPLINPLADLGESAQFYLMRGAEALEDRDYQAAAASYGRAVEQDGADFRAYRGLSYAVEHLGDLEGAIGHLETALERATTGDPEKNRQERAEVHRLLGGLQALAGRDEEAVDHFRSTLELAPGQGDARMKLANALARSRRFAEALEHYDALVAAHPEHAAEIYVKRATALVNLERHEEAVGDFERAVAADPENPETRLLYAEALDFLGRSEAAAEQWAAAARMAEDNPEKRARLLAEDAHRLVSQGRFEEAVAQLREVLELYPDRTPVRHELASVLGHLGRYDDALAEFRRVVEAEPRHAAARRGEILVLLLTGRHGEARLRLQEALREFPQDAQLAHTQARLLASTPDPRVRDGRLALEIARRLAAVRQDLRVRETLAMALAEAGRFGEAVEMQKSVVSEAEGRGAAELLRDVRQKLAAFERGEPWTAASGEEIVAVTIGNPAG